MRTTKPQREGPAQYGVTVQRDATRTIAMHKTVVLDVVGLSASVVSEQGTPFLWARYDRGRHREVDGVFPALTCAAQATYMTGTSSAVHGISANGFYDPMLNEVRNWHQSRAIVRGRRVFDAIKAADPTAVTFTNCTWHCMYDDAIDVMITPRPQYLSDGRKLPDCYTKPADLRDELQATLGTFPLHRFWGPLTSIESSSWIAEAAKIVDRKFDPVFSWIYLPHLDYVLQCDGPNDVHNLPADLKQIDDLARDLTEFYESRCARVIILSEYGISPVDQPIHINRMLADQGLLSLRRERNGFTLDCGASRAFALADHQIAQVYVHDRGDIPAVKTLLKRIDAIEYVYSEDDVPDWAKGGLSNGAQIICVANARSWFTYYFWQDDCSAPDYARTIAIHDKPGYDPCEMLLPYRWFRPAGITYLVYKFILSVVLRQRTLIDATPLDAAAEIRGSHGRTFGLDRQYRPIVMTDQVELFDGDHDLNGVDLYELFLRHLNCRSKFEQGA